MAGLYFHSPISIPAGIGGIDEHTKLMLHGDESPLVDSSLTPKTLIIGGSTARYPFESKFGGYSIFTDGTGADYLGIANSADFKFGSGDFTIDAWIYPTILNRFNPIAAQTDDAASGWFVDVNTSNYPRLVAHLGGSWGVVMTSDTAVTSAWYHLAVVRSGSNFYMFLDGTQVDSVVDAGSISDSSEDFEVGRIGTVAPVRWYAGYIDELRISKGIARWTSNFTPPTQPYTE